MQKIQEKKEYTILQLMEVLSEKSDDSQLSEAFWAENRSVAESPWPRLQKNALADGWGCNRGNVFPQKGRFSGRDCKKSAFYACLCAIAATPRPPVA